MAPVTKDVEVSRESMSAAASAEMVRENEKVEWNDDNESTESTCSEQVTTEPDDDTEVEHGKDAEPAAVRPAIAASPIASPGAEAESILADATKDDSANNTQEVRPFSFEETVFIFDWDDTILPSAWVQGQGLRLDEESKVSECQRQQLSEAANAAMETLRAAKQHGTVVLVTNAERGWIELSCQKFLPTLYPTLENLKLLSARTTYESPLRASPCDWKLCAFESEIERIFGEQVITSPEYRKNIFSLGDSIHEREALLRATASLPNCRSKSLKFMERPEIGQLCKQHSLISGCFERLVQHDGNLDLCIRCA